MCVAGGECPRERNTVPKRLTTGRLTQRAYNRPRERNKLKIAPIDIIPEIVASRAHNANERHARRRRHQRMMRVSNKHQLLCDNVFARNNPKPSERRNRRLPTQKCGSNVIIINHYPGQRHS